MADEPTTDTNSDDENENKSSKKDPYKDTDPDVPHAQRDGMTWSDEKGWTPKAD